MLRYYSTVRSIYFPDNVESNGYIYPPQQNHPKLYINIWSNLGNESSNKFKVFLGDNMAFGQYQSFFYLASLAPGQFIQVPFAGIIKIEQERVPKVSQYIYYSFISSQPFV